MKIEKEQQRANSTVGRCRHSDGASGRLGPESPEGRTSRSKRTVAPFFNFQFSIFNSSDRRGQEGFTLATLIVLLTIISIIVAYTVPQQWSLVMRRERERQTIFLMKQYARSIYEWQRKHNAPPTSLKQLRDARNPRMIRGSYEWPCPLTGSAEDWILVPPTAIIAEGIPQGGGPAAAVPAQGTQGQPAGGAPGVPAAGGRLNPEASPPDYEGPFVAVRPRAKGTSMIALNEAEDYSEWVYTVADLVQEIQARQAALSRR